MKKYEQPQVIGMEETAEGVYAASGTGAVESAGPTYTVEVHPTHTANHDGPDWRFDVNGTVTGGKWATQVVTITFDVPVTVNDPGKASSYSGDGTTTITLNYNAGKSEGSIMWGNIHVNSPTQPTVMSATVSEG